MEMLLQQVAIPTIGGLGITDWIALLIGGAATAIFLYVILVKKETAMWKGMNALVGLLGAAVFTYLATVALPALNLAALIPIAYIGDLVGITVSLLAKIGYQVLLAYALVFPIAFGMYYLIPRGLELAEFIRARVGA